MADATEPKGRYPRQEVSEGQKHGYIGEVEVYDPPQAEAGYSNASDAAPAGGTATSSTTRSSSRSRTTNQSASDVTPADKPVSGATGVVGGKVDNVSPPKK